MRTQEEIVARIEGLLQEGNNILGWRAKGLLAALRWEHARKLLQDSKRHESKWVVRYTDDAEVTAQIRSYLPYALRDAAAGRNARAWPAIWQLEAWFWLLGDDEACARLLRAQEGRDGTFLHVFEFCRDRIGLVDAPKPAGGQPMCEEHQDRPELDFSFVVTCLAFVVLLVAMGAVCMLGGCAGVTMRCPQPGAYSLQPVPLFHNCPAEVLAGLEQELAEPFIITPSTPCGIVTMHRAGSFLGCDVDYIASLGVQGGAVPIQGSVLAHVSNCTGELRTSCYAEFVLLPGSN